MNFRNVLEAKLAEKRNNEKDEPLMSYYIKYKCSKICGKCIMIIIGHCAFYSANFVIFSIDLLSDTLSERTINCSCFRHKGVDI